MTKIITYNNKYKEQLVKLILSILKDEFGYADTDIERQDLYDIQNVYQQDPKSNFWLAIYGNKVVGTIAIKYYGKDRGLLKRMYVKKEMRNKGIGQELTNTLLAFAKNSHYKNIFLSTVEKFVSARNFYKNKGFVEIKKLPEDLAAPTGDNVFLKLTL